jgi:capsular polysaccharide biosynthesis protein
MVYSDDFLIEVISNVYGRDEYPGLTPGYIRSVFSYTPIDNGMFRISVKTTNAELSQRIAQSFETLLEIEFLSYSNNALVAIPFDSAKIPTTSDDKGVLKNVVIGFVGGGVVAAVAVWLLYALDTTVRNKKKLEDNFTYTVLGCIPCEKKQKVGKEN